ncbi:MAG: serine/threonine protein kinase [Gemmatimonadetes bacterium]|uniref:Serine/threonine protein kinase n=1 Tax=Candidatus Kutchimonas denitrificans TaxID=3056748 RepID=A0AAE4ZCB3_9BACT|nr:serine/threonine protein kinase [Gemmatimonadota bacterium]NIR75836.1 serine/threonine protein kinase [Candidatus Kutchimonas denitrificans]NIS02003.1 serine/threonine protein kinase [Gemmatimonadota bacterium]NIT67807.1 serine/threonine protein kinase [Gemmatimonadota bacterium]NIU53794.1 protein kinase [Gemmatimonadota bacterium]
MTYLPDPTLRRLREVANWPDFSGTRYTVTEEIARGGMGTVYRATDGVLDREVAIKVSNTQSGHKELDDRMRTEARVLARLEHPGIVPIHDAGRTPDGRAYYVMKRVQGRTLVEYLQTTDDLNELLGIFERICEPVAFAHDRGCVHRDLKPENIMVGAFGEVLVMDWGVAKLLDEPHPEPVDDGGGGLETDGTRPGTVMGTRGYMPPEQARGQIDAIDQRADVYALGAILFTMLTGSSAPPAAADVSDLLGRRRGIPKRLRAICARAMAPDAEDRYPGAGRLAADIVRFRAGEPVDAYPETLLDRAARLATVYRTAILLVLAYLIMRVVVALLAG